MPKYIILVPINDESLLVYLMIWQQECNKSLPKPMMTSVANTIMSMG